MPLLVSGRTLPEVPGTHRTIFQLVPLHVVRGPQVRGWLKEAFDSKDLKILEDPDRSALLLKGDADTLARALAMIEVLDQPLLRGRYGLIVEPVFMSAGELAGALDSVLKAEGYQSSIGAGLWHGGPPRAREREQGDRLRRGAADPRPRRAVGAHPRHPAEGVDRGGGVHLRGAQHPGRGADRDPQPDSRRGGRRRSPSGAGPEPGGRSGAPGR